MALTRYQIAILLRSHRWVGPLLLYSVSMVFAGLAGSANQPLGAGLDWSAAMAVPAAAWLTRSALTAEPAAARACAAAAGGPYRTHLAALTAALAGGLVLALCGAAYELATCKGPAGGASTWASVMAAGLVTAAICVGVGSAAGALCNPPVIRKAGTAVLATISAVIVALVAGISPANAALRQVKTQPHSAGWLAGLPVLVAGAMLAGSWALSTMLSARRDGPRPDGG